MTRQPFAVWMILVALLGLQLTLTSAGLGIAAPFIGLAMALGIALGFMGLGRAPALARVFAAAGVFWLLVLLGLGNLDPATRTDLPVSQRTLVLPGRASSPGGFSR